MPPVLPPGSAILILVSIVAPPPASSALLWSLLRLPTSHRTSLYPPSPLGLSPPPSRFTNRSPPTVDPANASFNDFQHVLADTEPLPRPPSAPYTERIGVRGRAAQNAVQPQQKQETRLRSRPQGGHISVSHRICSRREGATILRVGAGADGPHAAHTVLPLPGAYVVCAASSSRARLDAGAHRLALP